VLPNLKLRYREWDSERHWLTAFCCLLALNVRHAPLQAEIRKALESHPGIPVRLHELIKAMTPPLPDRCFDALYRPEEGVAFFEHMAQVHVWLATHGADEAPPQRDELDRVAPRDFAVRWEINRTGDLSGTKMDLLGLLAPISWLGTLPGEDLFLPRSMVQEGNGYTEPRVIVQLGRVRAGLERRQVKREVPKVGRNDPCPCGSGAKYKRCCGADAD
jgi:hypothetical protein